MQIYRRKDFSEDDDDDISDSKVDRIFCSSILHPFALLDGQKSGQRKRNFSLDPGARGSNPVPDPGSGFQRVPDHQALPEVARHSKIVLQKSILGRSKSKLNLYS